MAWLDGIFGEGQSMGVNLALLFAILIVALLVIFWLFRKIFGGTATRLSKSRQPRLSITDAAVVDDKRRLVLVRRDNVEHLVLIGGTSDLVIEQNIVRAAPIAVSTAPVQQYTPPQPSAPPPITVPEASIEQKSAKAEPETSGLFTANPTNTTAALGSVALAGAGVLAQSAKEQTAEVTSNIAETIENTATDISNGATENVQSASSSLSGLVEKLPDVAAESASTDALHIEPVDIGADLSSDLESALSELTPPVETQTAAAKNETKTEDEMQRLLKELAAGN